MHRLQPVTRGRQACRGGSPRGAGLMARKRQPHSEVLRDEVECLRAQNEALQTRLYALQSAHRVLQGEDEEYSALRHRIREAVRKWVPVEEIVLVMSKGDVDLVDLYG